VDVLEQGMRQADAFGHMWLRCQRLHFLGEGYLLAGRPDEVAETRYREAMALATELEMRPLIAHCHLGLGKLFHRTDQREQAQVHLTTATTMYRGMGMTYWLEKAEAEEPGR